MAQVLGDDDFRSEKRKREEKREPRRSFLFAGRVRSR